eukprot:4299582-Karenia_brevis.AAC.1
MPAKGSPLRAPPCLTDINPGSSQAFFSGFKFHLFPSPQLSDAMGEEAKIFPSLTVAPRHHKLQHIFLDGGMFNVQRL